MKVSLEQISHDGNIRTKVDESQIDGLAKTMQLIGQQVPARGRMVDGKCVLTDGMRRYLAACKLGWTTLDVIIDEDELDESEMLERQLVTNCQRADLPILDKARAIARLMEAAGCNASEAASRLGMSNASVTRLIGLLSLPDEVQEQVANGKIAPSTAYELARVQDPEKQLTLARAAVAGRLTRDAATSQARRKKARTPTPQSRKVARASALLGNGCGVSVSGTDLSLETFIATLEETLGRARKARTKGWELGTFIRALKDQARSG